MSEVRSLWTRAARSPPADSCRDGDRSPGSHLARWPLCRAPRPVRVAVCDRRPSLRRGLGRAGLPLVDTGGRGRGTLRGGCQAGRTRLGRRAGRHPPPERDGGDGRAGIRTRGRGGSGVGGAGPTRRPRRGEDVAPRRAPRGGLLRPSRRRLPGQSRGRRRVPRGRGVPRRPPPVVVGGRRAPRRRWPGACAVPCPRDRGVRGSRRARLASGRPRRSPRHRAIRHGGRRRRGSRHPRDDRGTRSDRLRDVEGRVPPTGGTRPTARRRVPRAVPATGGPLRPVDLGPARRRWDGGRRCLGGKRVPPAVPRVVAHGDRGRCPCGLRHRMAPTGPARHVRVRRADRRGPRARMAPRKAGRARLVLVGGRRRARRVDDPRRASRLGPTGPVREPEGSRAGSRGRAPRRTPVGPAADRLHR